MRKHRGFSLVELLISLSIGAFLILGTSKLYLHSRAAFRTQEYTGQLAENARIASELLRSAIQNAGYWGCSGTDRFLIRNHLDMDGALINADGTSQNPYGPDYSQTDFQAIHGKRNSPASGTDEISVLHAVADTSIGVVDIESDLESSKKPAALNSKAKINVETTVDLEAGDLAVINDCSQADIFRISHVDQSQNKISLESCSTCSRRYHGYANIHKLEHTRFYVATGASGEPALYSSTNGYPGLELIEGVEKLRIYYGQDIDKDGSVERYVLPEVIDDSCVLSANQDCWNHVPSVRISLLLRTTQNNITQQAQSYSFDGKQLTANDGRLRREFITTVTLNNYH